jgi:tetratricopeptide (TPR) repeat protein
VTVARNFSLGALLLFLIACAYAFSLRGGFLWDDDLHITANPTIVGPLGLREIWTSARANYFPLVLTNFWLQHAAWGLEPLGYRVVTLAFHIGAAVLLWGVLRQLRVPGAWLGAALWALHPVQVESVAWICELKNTQSAVFFLASIWYWIRWIRPGPRATLVPPAPLVARSRYYIFAIGCAVAAILSKPSTVMLPVALGLCTWWVRGRLEWRDAWRLAPFFAFSAVAAGWTIWEQKFHSGAIGAEWSQTLPERIVIAGRVIWFYLGKLIWPDPLIFIYPRWQINAGNPLAYAAMVAAIATLVLFWRGRSGRLKPLLFGSLYFGALLFPVLGFFSVYFFRYSFVGDHFQYLASMGPLALAGAGIAKVSGRTTPFIASGLLVALGLATARQSRVYMSNEALWRDTTAHNPAAAMAWMNLADTFTQSGRYDEAIATFRRALQIRPDDPYGLNDLGNVLVLTGRVEEAIPKLERAIAVKPDLADAHSNLGNAVRTLGRSEDAIRHFRRALELNPAHTGALNNLGAELAQLGRPLEAVPLFEKALQLEPADAPAHDNLAGALREIGRFELALAQHAEALRLKPEFAEAHANLGRTLVVMGRPAEALPHFERALQLKPTHWAARNQYATALMALGRPADAFAQLQKAVELTPNLVEPHLNLGSALAQSGRPQDAIPHFEAAVALAPKLAVARANLANAFLALQRWPEAVQQLKEAAKLDPESFATQGQLAVALVNHGDLTAAVAHFETALRLKPAAAEVRENFAQVLNALGRKREAFEQLEEAARLRRIAR